MVLAKAIAGSLILLVTTRPFLPGIVSTPDANETTPTFSPDGRLMYFSRWSGTWGAAPSSPSVIYQSRLGAEGFSEPEPADFSGLHDDGDPFVAEDGFVYFTSSRPAPGKNDGSADIWRVRLAGGEPERLPPPVSSPEEEYSPVVAASGNLYFASSRPGGPGAGDVYVAHRNGTSFDAPRLLGPAVNSPTGEWNVWVNPTETLMILEASSRSTNVSVPGDLYLSVQSAAGWTPALPLREINGDGSDLLGRLASEGATLLYTSAASGGHASVREAPWAPVEAAALEPLSRVLAVANRSSHDVSFVSLREGRVIATVPVGKGPHLLSNVEDGRAVSTGYGQFPRPHLEPVAERPPFLVEPEPVLSVIDIETRTVTRRIELSACAHPHASWLANGKAFVTCEDEREIQLVDLESGAVETRFETDGAGSHVLAWHAGTRTLVVSNTEDGSVTLIDVDTGESSVVPLAAGSEGSLVVEERSEAWIGNAGDGSISVVDLGSREEAARIENVCRMPIALARRGADDLVWLACFASREMVSLDVASRSVVDRIVLSEQPLNLILHDDAPLAYVSLPRANAIAEIDLLQGAETRRIAVGIEPDGLRWAVP